MEIVRASGGRSELTMPFSRELAQGAGLMHGGALVSLADTAMVMAIKSILAPDTHFATVSLESRFLRPVLKGRVTARAQVIKQENRVIRGEARLYDEDGYEVMHFLSTFKIAREADRRSGSPYPVAASGPGAVPQPE